MAAVEILAALGQAVVLAVVLVVGVVGVGVGVDAAVVLVWAVPGAWTVRVGGSVRDGRRMARVGGPVRGR